MADILNRIAEYPTKYVVVTGGEPLIAPDIDELCAGLRQRGYHITIETAATIFKPIECDLASLSPKLSSSTPHQREQGKYAARHERLRLRLDVICAFMARSDYQLKFVIDQPSDIAEAAQLVEAVGAVDRTRVLLMPQGVTQEELRRRSLWLVEECKRLGFVYCPRLHIELCGNTRGT